MHYGGDYNPEQWPESVWHDDVRLMREAKVTMVSIGIFSWSRIQPAEGQYDWVWLDTIIDLLHANGIQVNLATATASPPPWATAAYPEMLPRDRSGAVLWPGSRQHFAPTSPVYRRLAAELVTAMAARYANHPGVASWHVNNEYGCHLHYDYSDSARDAFRDWLRGKYGTIESLNRAWGNAFWSQLCTSFDQVFPPRTMPYSPNPAAALDFKRFTSDALLELFVMERDIIRAAGATQPISTNFMGAFAPLDYWKWAREVDVVWDDNYPDPNDPQAFRASAFARDLMRSLKPGVPWLLMEQSTGALNWRPTNAPKAPGQMEALSMQAVGHGADGIFFFQWRQSRQGAEKFHSAMLPHAGRDTRIWNEVTRLGRTLADLPALDPRSGARVAIAFDWENWWAISNSDHPVVLDYASIVQRWYAALHAQHHSIDLVRPDGDLADYDLVLVPQLYLLTDAAARNLEAYVESGGNILVSAFTDVVDEDDAFRDGGFLVGLRDTLGITIEDFGALVTTGADAPGQASAPLRGPFGDVRGELLCEEIHVVDADVLAEFTGGRLDGRPAMTVRRTGAGSATYLATIPDDDGMRAVTRWAAAQAGVAPLLAGLPEMVEATQRGTVITLINHGTTGERIRVTGVDALTGDEFDELVLEPFEWRMLTVPDASASPSPDMR